MTEIEEWEVYIPDLRYVEVLPQKKRDQDPIYTHHIDNKAGLFLVHGVIKVRDSNEASQRLKPSEIGWQSFDSESKEIDK